MRTLQNSYLVVYIFCVSVAVLSAFAIAVSIGGMIERANNTVSAPKVDNDQNVEWLAGFADTKMKDLLNTDYWAHTNSDGCDFKCRAAQGDRDGRLVVGEDLYKGPCDLGKAYKMWQDSPKHKEILDAGFENLVILGKKKGDMCYITYEAQYTK